MVKCISDRTGDCLYPLWDKLLRHIARHTCDSAVIREAAAIYGSLRPLPFTLAVPCLLSTVCVVVGTLFGCASGAVTDLDLSCLPFCQYTLSLGGHSLLFTGVGFFCELFG